MLAQKNEHVSRLRRIGHQRAFGDFHRDTFRRSTFGIKNGEHPAWKCRLQQIAHRKIERDADLMIRATPNKRLPYCAFEHPLSETLDRPGLFGKRDELIRCNHASLRMDPAQKRFHTDDSISLETHFGL